MPRFSSPLPESFEAITRPVAYDIARTMGALMHMPAATKILFTGSVDQGAQVGSTLAYEGAPSAFTGNSRIEITLSERAEEAETLADSPLQNNAPIVMRDPNLRVVLKPVIATTRLTLTFNVRSRSKNEADKIREEYHMRSAAGRQTILHSVNYVYAIPSDIMELLKTIHGLREANAGYGEDFDTWLKKYASQRLTVLSTLNGSDPLHGFRETQIAVQGLLNFNVAPEEPERGDPDGTYNCPIEYAVRFDKVIGMAIDYPLVVHNQLLPTQYYGTVHAGGAIPQPYAATCSYADRTNTVYQKLFLNRKLRPSPIDGIRYPVFDDWMPRRVPLETSTAYSCLLSVDPNDPNAVLDLNELPGVLFDPDVKLYMLLVAGNLVKLYQAAVHVALFEGTTWLGDDAITISNDLKVRSVKPLSQRLTYHLRVSILNNLARLPDDERLKLRIQGKACQRILLAIQQRLYMGNLVPKLVGNGVVPDKYLLETIDRINVNKQGFFSGLEHVMLTVANVFINVKRTNDHASDAASDADAFEPSVPNLPRDCCTDPANRAC